VAARRLRAWCAGQGGFGFGVREKTEHGCQWGTSGSLCA
jgi:hypothetical protein